MKRIKDAREDIILTRGTKKLIAEAIRQTGTLNNTTLCDTICDSLCNKFSGDSLDYQLKRMNIQSTKAILDAIDVFIYQNTTESGIVLNGKEHQV